MEELAKALKALSEETRLRITALLIWRGELCVCDVEGVLGITQSKASRHLRYLLNAGLVKNRRVGVWMHYFIPKDLEPPQKQIVAMLERIFAGVDHDGLGARLEEWLKRKESEAPTC